MCLTFHNQTLIGFFQQTLIEHFSSNLEIFFSIAIMIVIENPIRINHGSVFFQPDPGFRITVF